MSPVVTVIGAALFAFLAGGLGNWAADVLPGWNRRQQQSLTPARSIRHYWTLWWYPFHHGICPHCGEKRPWRAPALEAAMLAIFFGSLVAFGSLQWIVGLIWLYSAFLMTVLVIDYEQRRVLNVMLAPAAVVVLLLSFLPITPPPLNVLLGGAVGFGAFLLLAIIGRGALGAGDVKLAGVIGLMVGYPNVFTALAIGIILGGVAALLLLATRRATRKSTMAYAPYLCLGTLIVLLSA